MTYRYPEDPNDRTGQGVEQNNSRLVDDNGNRIPPAIRPAQDSDPSCDYTINAPARQLCDRLALLESKVPLCGEAGVANRHDLKMNANLIVGDRVSITIQPDDWILSSYDMLGSQDYMDVYAFDLPEAPSTGPTTTLKIGDGEEASGLFALFAFGWFFEGVKEVIALDNQRLLYVKRDDNDELLRPSEEITISYHTRNSAIIGGDLTVGGKTKAESFEAGVENFHIKMNTNGILFEEVDPDSGEKERHFSVDHCGNANANAITINNKTSLAVPLEIQNSQGETIIKATQEGSVIARKIETDAISAKTSGGAITVESDINAEGKRITANKFLGEGTLKAIGIIRVQVNPTATGSYASSGEVLSGWNIRHKMTDVFSIVGVTCDCTAIVFQLSVDNSVASINTRGVGARTVYYSESDGGRLEINAPGYHLVFVV